MDRVFFLTLWPKREARVDYSGKRTKSFDVLTSDQELEVRTATYGSEIDQSQRAKSVSHIIIVSYEGPKSARCSFIFCTVHLRSTSLQSARWEKDWSD